MPVAEVKEPLLKDQGVDFVGEAGEINIATASNGVAGVIFPSAVMADSVFFKQQAVRVGLWGFLSGAGYSLLRCDFAGLEAGGENQGLYDRAGWIAFIYSSIY